MTGYSPAQLMIQRSFRVPLTIIQPAVHFPTDTGHEDIQDLATAIAARQQRVKDYYDGRHRARNSTFDSGELVRVNNPVRRNKMAPAFSKPLRITRRVLLSTYRLEDGSL